MNKIFGMIKKGVARVFKYENHYISKVEGAKEWVYISYIPEVFYNLWNEKYMNGHQSRQEMVKMVSIFNTMGYNVYVSNHVNYTLPDIDVKLIFGIEPGFVFAAKKYCNAKKIYYATGAYYGHQNKSIKERTDSFNRNNKTAYPYQRLVDIYNHLDFADKILQIGSKFTIDTYPEKYRGLITTIHQSSTVNINNEYEIRYAPENEFMWIGGGGTILKGLDLIFDYFIANPSKTVHIIGVIDKEFLDIYQNRLTENIHLHGFMNLNSEEFTSLAGRCNFLIYPSCTEGGCPGSVINAMAYGLIPIVSRWAACDEIDGLGYILNDLTLDSITSTIDYIDKLSLNEVTIKKGQCQNYVRDTHNLVRFVDEFTSYLKKIGV